jgi:hypothetical protein
MGKILKINIVKILKNIIFLLNYNFNYYRKFNLINKFDKEKNLYHKINNNDELQKNGYKIYNFYDFFGFDFKNFIDLKNLNEKVVYNKFGHFKSFDLNEKLLAKILNSEKLNEILKSYINEYVRLDNAYFDFQKNLDNKSFSEGWHRDDAGKRLKIFFCIEARGEPTSTFIIPPNNKFNFNILKLETERFFTLNKIKSHPLEKKIEHKEGYFVVFDTNITHRAYRSSQKGVRKCLVLEFIDRRKSNKIHKFSSCGPGTDKDSFIKFNKKNFESLEKSNLIDSQMVIVKDKEIMYQIN